MDDSHSGQQTLGSERYIELELDRNTEFVDPKAVVAKEQVPDSRNDAVGQVVQRRDPLDDFLRDIIPMFPIIRSQGKGCYQPAVIAFNRIVNITVAAPTIQPLPYACAPTTNMYFDYHEGHRKALEVSIRYLAKARMCNSSFPRGVVAQVSGVSTGGAAKSCRK